MKDNAGGDPGLILRRAAELRVDASDWKGADGDKRNGKLPAVEIQRGKSVAEARIVLVPPVETPEVGVAAERFDRSLAPWKLLGTRKTNPKRAKNLRPAAGNKKGAQQEHGGYFARFDLVLCLAWIGISNHAVPFRTVPAACWAGDPEVDVKPPGPLDALPNSPQSDR